MKDDLNGSSWSVTNLLRRFLLVCFCVSPSIVEYSECFSRSHYYFFGCIRTRVAHIAYPTIKLCSSSPLVSDCCKCVDWASGSSSNESYCSNTIISRATVLRNTAVLVLGTALSGKDVANAASSIAEESSKGIVLVPKDIVLTLPATQKNSQQIRIPRVGYSFYKTDPQMVQTCLDLALDAGVRHFDVATMYQSNEHIGKALFMLMKKYSLKRRDICFAHKLSNEEQSVNGGDVRRAVRRAMSELGVSYLDVCYIHSPLTSSDRRLATYKSLRDLQTSGIIHAVGVCHYGVPALNEILASGCPPPSIIQLELSPFNQHKDVVQWAKIHGSAISCAAWSKLSSIDGPQEGWTILSRIAKDKGVTKVS